MPDLFQIAFAAVVLVALVVLCVWLYRKYLVSPSVDAPRAAGKLNYSVV